MVFIHGISVESYFPKLLTSFPVCLCAFIKTQNHFCVFYSPTVNHCICFSVASNFNRKHSLSFSSSSLRDVFHSPESCMMAWVGLGVGVGVVWKYMWVFAWETLFSYLFVYFTHTFIHVSTFIGKAVFTIESLKDPFRLQHFFCHVK